MGPWTPPHHPKRQDGQDHSTTALSPTVNRGGKEPATTGSFIMISLRWEMIRFGNTVLFQNQLFFFWTALSSFWHEGFSSCGMQAPEHMGSVVQNQTCVLCIGGGFFKLFTYLFMAVLGLCCGTGFSLAVASAWAILTAAASLIVVHRL